MTPQHLLECLDAIATSIWTCEQHILKRNDARWEALSDIEKATPRMQAFAALNAMATLSNGAFPNATHT